MNTAPHAVPLGWFRSASQPARTALLAASLGWMLDSFDIMLYALVLPAVMASLHLSKGRAGALGSLTLVAASAGGVLFGLAADRWGRARALVASVLLYAVFTAACGLAWSFASLAVFRVLLGFGMGGEWATGAALVSETWPKKDRDKALAWMQSSFAIGYGLAAVVVYLLLPVAGWRGVFFAGLLPAGLTAWMRRRVPEPEAWQRSRESAHSRADTGLSALFRGPYLRRTVTLTAMNACCLFAWWGFNLWVPSYLSLQRTRGGMGFTSRSMTLVLVAMQAGMWCGYVSFGYLASRFGRTRTYIAFLLSAAALLVLFAALSSPWLLLLAGPSLAFAGTGYFSGFGAVTAGAFPTALRATGQGLTYNLGRLASAAAPYLVGSLAERHGFRTALHMDAAVFLLAAALWAVIPPGDVEGS